MKLERKTGSFFKPEQGLAYNYYKRWGVQVNEAIQKGDDAKLAKLLLNKAGIPHNFRHLFYDQFQTIKIAPTIKTLTKPSV